MIIETKEGLKILKGTYHEELLIDSSRINECIDYLFKNNLKYISINSFNGYKIKRIDFLEQLKDYLEGISVLDTHFDIKIVNSIQSLKYLSVQDNGKDVLDLRNFPKLEVCGVEYSPRLVGLEGCKKLKDLTLNKFKPTKKDMTSFPNLPLKKLHLIKPDIISLCGIDRLKSIVDVEIYGASKLIHIRDLVGTKNSLEVLSLDGCKKIEDYESIVELSKLRKLVVIESGNFKSLSFIKSMKKLKFFSFWGTNVLDGDISPCIGIDYVAFDNKKHYTHKSEQFKI